MTRPLGSVPYEPPPAALLPPNPTETLDLHRTRIGDSQATGDEVVERTPSLHVQSMAVPESAAPRLKLKSFLAEGGLGEVWVAAQTALRRIVAVKKPKRALLKRFADRPAIITELQNGVVQEALLLARLDHPNIAPIYDLTCDDEGPKLAMKLVKGRRWKELLEKDRMALPGDVYLARHVSILVSVSQAVSFAHSKGIVHRDIKPGQVMIGEFGEVFLMDWGLAMVFDEDLALQEGVEPTWGLPTRETAPSPGGTVAFMAPEQTKDTAEEVGPWTDVFLLGGTLYYILTGGGPYEGERDSTAAFRRAVIGEVASAAERSPSSPRELAALCQRALARDIRERPPSVLAFIEGLQAYLTGATKRSEAEALAKEASEALATASSYRAFAEGIAKLDRARAIWPEMPKSSELHERALAGYSRLALERDDRKLARVQAERMSPSPERDSLLSDVERKEQKHLRQARQRKVALALCGLLLLASAVAGYQYTIRVRQARQRADAARQQADALVQYMLGDLYAQLEPLGQTKILNKAGEKAIEYFDGLPHEDQTDSSILRRALVLEQVGRVQEANGSSDLAIRTLGRSVESLEALLGGPGRRGEVRKSLVSVYTTLSNVLRRVGRRHDALLLIEKQEKLLSEALREQPGDQDLRRGAATTAIAASRLLQADGELEKARAFAEKGLALREEIHRAAPEEVAGGRDLSIAQNELGRILVKLGRLGPARENLENALVTAEDLVRRAPEDRKLRRGLGICHDDLAQLLLVQGKLDEAEPHVARFQELANELHERDPNNVEWYSNLALSFRSAGELKLSAGDGLGAERLFAQFEEPARSLAQKEPQSATWRQFLVQARIYRAEALMQSGRSGDASKIVLEARKILDKATSEKGALAKCRGWASLLEAESLLQKGESDTARSLLEKAAVTLETDALPDSHTQVLRLRVALDLGQMDKAESLARALIDGGFRERRFQKLVREKLPALANAL